MFCKICQKDTHFTNMCDAKNRPSPTAYGRPAGIQQQQQAQPDLAAAIKMLVDALTNLQPKPEPQVKQETKPKDSTRINVLGDEQREQRPFLSARVADLSVAALLDTGSSITACNSRLFDQIQNAGFSLIDCDPKICFMANGEAAEIRGMTYVPIQVGSRSNRTAVYLLQGLSCPLLLGIDFQKAVGLHYLPCNNELFLQSRSKGEPVEKIPLFPYISEVVPRVSAIEAEHITPIPEENEPEKEMINFNFDHPEMTTEHSQQLKEILTEEFTASQLNKGLPMVGPPVKLVYDQDTKPL